MNPNQDNHSIDQYMKYLDDKCQPAFQAAHWDQLDHMLNQLPPTRTVQGERQQDKGGINQSSSLLKGIIISSVVVIMSASFIWYNGKSAGSPSLNSLGTFIHLNEDNFAKPNYMEVQNSEVIDLSSSNHESHAETSDPAQRTKIELTSSQANQNKVTFNPKNNQSINPNTISKEQFRSIPEQQTGQKESEILPADTLKIDSTEKDSIPVGKKKKFLFW